MYRGKAPTDEPQRKHRAKHAHTERNNMNVYITLAVIAVAVFAAMNLIGFLWAHTEAAKENRRFKQALHNAKHGVQPILHD